MEAGAGYQGCLRSCELQIHSRRSISGGLAKWKFVDCARNLRDLEIGTQSQDSENVQHNLEIAQILRLRGTYIGLIRMTMLPLVYTCMDLYHASGCCAISMYIMWYTYMYIRSA